MPRNFWLQEYYCQFMDTDDQIFSYDVVQSAFDDPKVKPLEF